MIRAALRYPWSGIVVDRDGDVAAATSIWIPPDAAELTEADEHELEVVLAAPLGADGAAACYTLFGRFEANHRRGEPHAYLSLLATHPDHRGRGLGMALLADDLRRLDAAHVAAWLESMNPANDRRYQSVGFEPVGAFRTTDE